VETPCRRVGWSILIRSRGRASGRENPVVCQHWKENAEGVKIIPAQIYAGVDNLQAGVSQGMNRRLQEVEQVQSMIAEEVGAFERWFRSLSVVATISDLRQCVDAFRKLELARTMRQLSSSLSEREAAAIQELNTRLINKLLHTPTLRLKEAAAVGQGQVYAEALRYLFDCAHVFCGRGPDF